MPTLELEQLLQQLCDREGLDLSDRLARVKSSALMIWRRPCSVSLFEHGVAHSERLIRLLAQVLTHLRWTSDALTPHELYILLAACYLHDIAMWDPAVAGRSRENLTAQDYDAIRQEHPKRSRELILSRTLNVTGGPFTLDLDPTPEYLVTLALVCQAQQRNSFADCLRELDAVPFRPGGTILRGGLLASLLMVVDSLDLHYVDLNLVDSLSLPPSVSLPAYLRAFVADVCVEPGPTARDRKVRVVLQFPTNAQEYAPMVSAWLSQAIAPQLFQTMALVDTTTQGSLRWVPEISIQESIDSYGVVRELPGSIRVELLRQTVQRETVDFEDARAQLTHALIHEPATSVVCLVSQDELALAHVLRWVEAAVIEHGVQALRCDFHNEPYGVSDLSAKVQGWLTGNLPIDAISTLSANRPDEDLRGGDWTWLAAIEQPNASRALLLQNLDRAVSQTATWAGRTLPQELRRLNCRIPIIITCHDLPHIKDGVPPDWRVVHLRNIPMESIGDYLQQTLGWNSTLAREEAEFIYGTADSGLPKCVLFALEQRRTRQTRRSHV